MINGLYKGHNIIIGGGSSFIDSIDFSLLKDQIVIGCNCWGQLFPCTWCITVDSIKWPVDVYKYIQDKGIKTVLNSISVFPAEYKQYADLLYKRDGGSKLPEFYNGTLRCRNGVSTAALQLACHFGAKNILLLGIDFTPEYSRYWLHKDTIDIHKAERFGKECKCYESTYKVKVYQANKNAKTNLDVMSLEDFICL